MSACKSCGATIMWRKNRTTGKSVPVDVGPRADGNVKLISGTDVVIVGKGQGTHVLHFTSCPNAAEHRKAKR